MTSGSWALTLKATDYQGLSTFDYFTLDIFSTTPYLDPANVTCAQDTYKYLDNEPEGVYYINFKPCFKPTTY